MISVAGTFTIIKGSAGRNNRTFGVLPEARMDMYFNFTSLFSAMLFVSIGILLYVAALRFLAPVVAAMLRKHVPEIGETSFAILLGFVLLGIGVIIASAVH
ncbi:MAG: hypothetical protein KIT09_31610 [Bryobacteraceae bacterium]|nr:hypothetical protein [Bryobacteraceae bacterium]